MAKKNTFVLELRVDPTDVAICAEFLAQEGVVCTSRAQVMREVLRTFSDSVRDKVPEAANNPNDALAKRGLIVQKSRARTEQKLIVAKATQSEKAEDKIKSLADQVAEKLTSTNGDDHEREV